MALNIDKQVRYWQTGGEDAMGTAELLIAHGRWGFGLFLAHLALEKALKALLTARTRELPPRSPDLLALARCAAISPPADIMAVLGEFQAYCLAGRYPDSEPADLDHALAQRELTRAREAYTWLQSQFNA